MLYFIRWYFGLSFLGILFSLFWLIYKPIKGGQITYAQVGKLIMQLFVWLFFYWDIFEDGTSQDKYLWLFFRFVVFSCVGFVTTVHIDNYGAIGLFFNKDDGVNLYDFLARLFLGRPKRQSNKNKIDNENKINSNKLDGQIKAEFEEDYTYEIDQEQDTNGNVLNTVNADLIWTDINSALNQNLINTSISKMKEIVGKTDLSGSDLDKYFENKIVLSFLTPDQKNKIEYMKDTIYDVVLNKITSDQPLTLYEEIIYDSFLDFIDGLSFSFDSTRVISGLVQYNYFTSLPTLLSGTFWIYALSIDVQKNPLKFADNLNQTTIIDGNEYSIESVTTSKALVYDEILNGSADGKDRLYAVMSRDDNNGFQIYRYLPLKDVNPFKSVSENGNNIDPNKLSWGDFDFVEVKRRLNLGYMNEANLGSLATILRGDNTGTIWNTSMNNFWDFVYAIIYLNRFSTEESYEFDSTGVITPRIKKRFANLLNKYGSKLKLKIDFGSIINKNKTQNKIQSKNITITYRIKDSFKETNLFISFIYLIKLNLMTSDLLIKFLLDENGSNGIPRILLNENISEDIIRTYVDNIHNPNVDPTSVSIIDSSIKNLILFFFGGENERYWNGEEPVKILLIDIFRIIVNDPLLELDLSSINSDLPIVQAIRNLFILYFEKIKQDKNTDIYNALLIELNKEELDSIQIFEEIENILTSEDNEINQSEEIALNVSKYIFDDILINLTYSIKISDIINTFFSDALGRLDLINGVNDRSYRRNDKNNMNENNIYNDLAKSIKDSLLMKNFKRQDPTESLSQFAQFIAVGDIQENPTDIVELILENFSFVQVKTTIEKALNQTIRETPFSILKVSDIINNTTSSVVKDLLQNIIPAEDQDTTVSEYFNDFVGDSVIDLETLTIDRFIKALSFAFDSGSSVLTIFNIFYDQSLNTLQKLWRSSGFLIVLLLNVFATDTVNIVLPLTRYLLEDVVFTTSKINIFVPWWIIISLLYIIDSVMIYFFAGNRIFGKFVAKIFEFLGLSVLEYKY